MSTFGVLESPAKLDKNDEKVFDGNFFTVKSGSYRITVVAIYSHRYTDPITAKEKITVKQIQVSIS